MKLYIKIVPEDGGMPVSREYTLEEVHNEFLAQLEEVFGDVNPKELEIRVTEEYVDLLNYKIDFTEKSVDIHFTGKITLKQFPVIMPLLMQTCTPVGIDIEAIKSLLVMRVEGAATIYYDYGVVVLNSEFIEFNIHIKDVMQFLV